MYRSFQRQFIGFIAWVILHLLPILTPISIFEIPKTFAAGQESREYILKAGFIYNFTKFIQWPKPVNGEIENGGLILCVAGEDPFGSILDQLVEKLKKRKKILHVKRGISLKESSQCHILFISQSKKAQLKQIIAQVQGSPVLLIGDTPTYARNGVGINFFIQKNKIRFEINQGALERAGFKISSELLSLARIVRENN